MNPSLAKVIHYLLNPFAVPFLGMYLLFNCCTTLAPFSTTARTTLLLLIFIFTCAFPLVSLYLLHSTAFIKSTRLESKPERLAIMLTTTAYFFMLSYILIDKIGLSMQLSGLILSLSLTAFTASVCSLFLKLDLHALSLSSFLGLLLALQITNRDMDLLLPFILVLMASGLAMSSKLAKQRSPHEVYSAFLVGVFACTCFTFLLA